MPSSTSSVVLNEDDESMDRTPSGPSAIIVPISSSFPAEIDVTVAHRQPDNVYGQKIICFHVEGKPFIHPTYNTIIESRDLRPTHRPATPNYMRMGFGLNPMLAISCVLHLSSTFIYLRTALPQFQNRTRCL
jgi:hypothetical protein